MVEKHYRAQLLEFQGHHHQYLLQIIIRNKSFQNYILSKFEGIINQIH